MKSTELTEAQWRLIQPILPRVNRRGRPREEDRKTLNGILWILRTGARWQDLPRKYGSSSTCWRRLQRWQEKGVWAKVLRVLLGQLGKRGRLKLSHSYLDGSFAPAKRGRRSWKNQERQRHQVGADRREKRYAAVFRAGLGAVARAEAGSAGAGIGVYPPGSRTAPEAASSDCSGPGLRLRRVPSIAQACPNQALHPQAEIGRFLGRPTSSGGNLPARPGIGADG